MRRALWFKPFAIVLAFWFPLVAGEPSLMHVCPMHMAMGAASMTQSHAHHGADAMSGGEMQRAQHAPASIPRDGHQHHDCSCITCCCCASVATFIASGGLILRVADVVPRDRGPISAYETLARPAPEFSLPYTTGPPASLTARAAHSGTPSTHVT